MANKDHHARLQLRVDAFLPIGNQDAGVSGEKNGKIDNFSTSSDAIANPRVRHSSSHSFLKASSSIVSLWMRWLPDCKLKKAPIHSAQRILGKKDHNTKSKRRRLRPLYVGPGL
ncbi:MAG: hypothetical protein ABJ360_10615, partial [Roseobacter sp.]